MRIFKNKWFTHYVKKEKITNEQLKQAIEDIENGRIDCDYSQGVIKQRIARKGQGKSGGYRSIIFFKAKDKAFFVFYFAKKDKDNLNKEELALYKQASGYFLNLSDDDIQKLLDNKDLTEVIS